MTDTKTFSPAKHHETTFSWDTGPPRSSEGSVLSLSGCGNVTSKSMAGVPSCLDYMFLSSLDAFHQLWEGNLKITKLPVWENDSEGLLGKQAIFRRRLLSWTSAATFQPPANPAGFGPGPTIWTGSGQYILLLFVLNSEFLCTDRLPQFVSSLKSRGDCVSSQGPLCSPKWWVFSLQFQSFSLYLWCIVTCCLVTRSCLTLCDPTDCSTPGFPVLHHLPELAQTHVHWVSDAIQPSQPVVPFSSCLQSFPASGSFPMSRLFTSGGQSIGASASASVLAMNIQGWFPLGCTGLIFLLSNYTIP